MSGVTATLQVTITVSFDDDGEMELVDQAVDAMRDQWSELEREASVDRVWIEDNAELKP